MCNETSMTKKGLFLNYGWPMHPGFGVELHISGSLQQFAIIYSVSKLFLETFSIISYPNRMPQASSFLGNGKGPGVIHFHPHPQHEHRIVFRVSTCSPRRSLPGEELRDGIAFLSHFTFRRIDTHHLRHPTPQYTEIIELVLEW